MKTAISNNNYDKSSTGTDIEAVCFYDTDISRHYFEENFKIVQHDGYRTNTIAWYTDNGNVAGPESVKFKLKGTLEQKTAYLEKQGYTGDDMPQLEDINDRILDTYGERITILNYEDASKVFSPLSVEPSKHIEKIITRGYSQGDYAEVLYCPDDLESAWGNRPKESELKTLFHHLFWDAPIYANFEINGSAYSYSDAPEYNEYEWKREEFLAYVAKESGVNKETLSALLPKEPGYL